MLLAALTLLVLAAGTAHAETYVEGYLGNNFTVTSPNPLELDINPLFRGPAKADLEFPRTVSSAFMVGAKLGIWFSKQGFPRFDYPDWMKYVGVYLDFNFHGFDKSDLTFNTMGSRRMYLPLTNYPYFQNYKFWLRKDASIITLAFMFAIRYGFNPTEQVPFGKWQPYVAVGPALFITSMKPTFKIQPTNTFFPVVAETGIDYESSFKSTVSLGLATEIGLRYMIRRFLSVETSVKYRYTRPSTTYDLDIFGFTHQLRYAPQFNLFSIHAGVAYHF